jgi:hypothetical protein
MNPVTSRVIQGGDLSPGKRAPEHVDLRLPGPLTLHVDASAPWQDGPRPSASGLGLVVNAISVVNSRYATGLLVPRELHLRFLTLSGLDGEWLADTGYGIPPTSYDEPSNTITAGEALGSTQGEPQSPSSSLPVTVHEYGHALFLLNLENALPIVREWSELVRRGAALQYRLDQAGRSIHGGEPCVLDPNLLAILLRDPSINSDAVRAQCDVWLGIRGQLDPVQAQIKAHPVSAKIGPYEELFSDLVAVLETGSPTSMETALLLPGLRDRSSFATKTHLRSFLDCPSPNQMNPDSSDPRGHTYFAPVRCELGRELLDEKSSRTLLGRAFEIFAKDLAESIEQNRAIDPAADNQRLIQELEKQR